MPSTRLSICNQRHLWTSSDSYTYYSYVHVLHPTSSVNFTQQRVKISDLDQLTDYAIQVLAQRM